MPIPVPNNLALQALNAAADKRPKPKPLEGEVYSDFTDPTDFIPTNLLKNAVKKGGGLALGKVAFDRVSTQEIYNRAKDYLLARIQSGKENPLFARMIKAVEEHPRIIDIRNDPIQATELLQGKGNYKGLYSYFDPITPWDTHSVNLNVPYPATTDMYTRLGWLEPSSKTLADRIMAHEVFGHGFQAGVAGYNGEYPGLRWLEKYSQHKQPRELLSTYIERMFPLSGEYYGAPYIHDWDLFKRFTEDAIRKMPKGM